MVLLKLEVSLDVALLEWFVSAAYGLEFSTIFHCVLVFLDLACPFCDVLFIFALVSRYFLS